MSLDLAGASTQYIINSASPITAVPFTVGAWVRLAAAGAVARTVICITDTAVADHYWLVRMNATEQLTIVARAGGTENTTLVANPLTAEMWAFFVARFIAAANRRLSVLTHNGGVVTATTNTNRVTTGIDTMTLGCTYTSGGASEPWDGEIAEYWIANGDILADAAANLTTQDVFRLAYGGPFAYRSLAGKIVEYRSFRSGIVAGKGSELYRPCVFTNTNGATLGPHPPLPYWYVRPGQVQRPLVI